MSPLRRRMLEDLQLRNFSANTQGAYVRAVMQFTRFFRAPPETLTVKHARQFLLYLVQERKVSCSCYNQIRAGLLFFFRVTLGRDESIDGVPCARHRRRMPIVLSQEELQRFFAVIRNKKHLAMFMTMYGAGLRVSELIHLRVEDIDSARMLLRVREGKGQKQRYAKLSTHLLAVLRDYYKVHHPKGWLFAGKSPVNPQPHDAQSGDEVPAEAGRDQKERHAAHVPSFLRHPYIGCSGASLGSAPGCFLA